MSDKPSAKYKVGDIVLHSGRLDAGCAIILSVFEIRDKEFIYNVYHFSKKHRIKKWCKESYLSLVVK